MLPRPQPHYSAARITRAGFTTAAGSESGLVTTAALLGARLVLPDACSNSGSVRRLVPYRGVPALAVSDARRLDSWSVRASRIRKINLNGVLR